MRSLSGGSRGRLTWAAPLLLLFAAGCNPTQTAIKIGARVVGEVVEDVDVQQRARDLVGRPVTDADQQFGRPVDVFRDVNSARRWKTYPVKLDVLGRQRYVVEVLSGKIVSVSKAEPSGREVDIPRAVILKETLKGKTSRECEAKLSMGRPLLEARSEVSKRLVQIYDAGMLTDLGTPHYCIVRYDARDRCDDVDFVAVGASTKKNPAGG